MIRNRIPSMQPLRTLALVATAVTAVACADRAAPTSLAELEAGANAARDSVECDLTISGTISRFSGAGDSASDTLGRRAPLPGARIELYYLGPVPRDSVPRDSVPRDSIPRDSIPRDSVPRDSAGGWDTLWLRSAALRRAPGDTIAPPPAQLIDRATSRGDGSYTLSGLCPGVYRIGVTEPGGRSAFRFITVRGFLRNVDVVFPPRR